MLKDSLVQEVDLFLLKPLMVSKYQALIMHHLTAALADQKAGKNARLNLLKGVQQGGIQAWLGVAGPDDARRIVGMLFTSTYTDTYLDVKNMLIYGLHMNEQISPAAMKNGIDVLAGHARNCGCVQMVTQTNVRGLSRILKDNGWTNGPAVLTKEL